MFRENIETIKGKEVDIMIGNHYHITIYHYHKIQLLENYIKITNPFDEKVLLFNDKDIKMILIKG